MMATLSAGANNIGLTSGSTFLLASGLPTGGQSVASATVTPSTNSRGTTPTATSATSASGANTGNTGLDVSFAPAKRTGGSVWDLYNFDAADLMLGLHNGDMVATI